MTKRETYNQARGRGQRMLDRQPHCRQEEQRSGSLRCARQGRGGPARGPPNTPSAAAAAAPAGAGGCRRPLSLLHTWSPCGRKGAVEGTSHALDRGPRQLARSTLRLPRLAPTNRRAAGSSPALQRGCGRGGITPAVAATMTNEEQS